MRTIFFLSGLMMLFASGVTKAGNSLINTGNKAVKKAVVYTTAENTRLRLSITDTLKPVSYTHLTLPTNREV